MFETAARRAVWNRLVAQNHPWWQDVKAAADGYIAGSPRYGDGGMWCTLAYGWSGLSVYGNAAKAALQSTAATDPDTLEFGGTRNGTRENLWWIAWMANWLRPLFTTAEWNTLVSQIDTNWAQKSFDLEKALFDAFGAWSDSDNTVGIFMGLVLWDLVTGRTTWRSNPNVCSVPSVLATGANQTSSMRNAVAAYCTAAAGGEWIESTEYNPGTVKLLLAGYDGVKTLLGSDPFAQDVTPLLTPFARAFMEHAAPDLSAPYQWGDEEAPHYWSSYHWSQTFKMLEGMLGNADEAKWLRRMTQDLGWASLAPFPVVYLFSDPDSPAADFRGALPNQYQCDGQGFVFHRTGWGANDSLFVAHARPPEGQVYVDHQVKHLGDWQLYRGGNWAVTHPLDYAGPAVLWPWGVNTVSLAGLGYMSNLTDFKREQGAGYSYSRCRTDGPYYYGGYDPPPAFVAEWARSLLYLPQVAGGPDLVISCDRINANNPTRVDRYAPVDQAAIAGHQLKELRVHSPVAPTISGLTASWTGPNGLPVQVKVISPATATLSSVNEQTAFGSTFSEYLYHLLVSSTAQGFTPFLTVVQAGAAALTVTELNSSSGRFKGVQITQAGQPDRVVFFSVDAAARVQASGDTFAFTAGASGADVMIFDLDPAREWRRGGVLQTVTGAGMLRLSLSSGAQSVALASTVNSPPTLAAIADQAIAAASQSVIVPLTAADPDGDQITFTAVYSGFVYFPSYDNYGGVGDKWFQNGGGTGPWFFLLSNGEFHRWNGTVGQAVGPLVGVVGGTAYSTPSTITTPNVTLSVSGTTLTVARGSSTWYGAAVVTVTASDGRGGTASRQFAVAAASPAVPLPRISSFAPARSSITAGETTSLSVAFSDSVDCTVKKILPTPEVLLATFTPPPGAGSVNVSPTVTTTYRATARNSAGDTVTADRTVTVVPAPVISSFTASGGASASITAGQSATLAASFSGSDCVIERTVPAPVQLVTTFSASGSVVVTPPGPGTYTYRARAHNTLGYEVTATVTLTVVAAPVISQFSVPQLRLVFQDCTNVVVNKVSPLPVETVATVATSPAVITLAAPPGPGNYTYRATAQNSLGFTITKDLVVSPPS